MNLMKGLKKIDCYIIGAGGHARVVASIILGSEKKLSLVGFIDSIKKTQDEKIFDKPIIKPELFNALSKQNIGFIVGIGDNSLRKQQYIDWIKEGIIPIEAIHKNAIIDYTVEIGKGTVVAAGAILSTLCKIGQNTIINTGSIIDHETEIGSHSHVASGVSIAGRVKIGDETFIGIGANIKDSISIGNNVIIGAGAVVLKDIPDNSIAVGVPAKIIKRNYTLETESS